MSGFREVWTVVRPVRDRHGDDTGFTEHTISGVIAAPAGSEEDSGGDYRSATRSDQRASTRLDLYLPVDADVAPADRLRRPSDPEPRDDTPLVKRAPWIAVGQAGRWRSPFGSWQPGSVLRVERHS